AIPNLSISHSEDYGAALISNTPCGIDIQYHDPGLERVKERFCTETEERLLARQTPELSTLSRLSLLWAGKEALKKMLSPEGMPGFQELKLCSLSAHEHGNMVLYFAGAKESDSLLTVAAGFLDNSYSLALCCKTASNNHQ
ncbi:MAG: 4'-phosphopantetheinyl transferase superfamily protein, partial [Thermodesulfobacteriota bacterium]